MASVHTIRFGGAQRGGGGSPMLLLCTFIYPKRVLFRDSARERESRSASAPSPSSSLATSSPICLCSFRGTVGNHVGREEQEALQGAQGRQEESVSRPHRRFPRRSRALAGTPEVAALGGVAEGSGTGGWAGGLRGVECSERGSVSDSLLPRPLFLSAVPTCSSARNGTPSRRRRCSTCATCARRW